MTRALRQRHRRIVIVLSVFLPMAFVAGIAMRKPPSVNISLSEQLIATPPTSAMLEWERNDLFTKTPTQVRLLHAPNERLAVELFRAKDFVKPDVLVYWIARMPADKATLPDEAVLLGALNPATPLLLPASARSGGALVLYSLADQEIVEISQAITLRKN